MYLYFLILIILYAEWQEEEDKRNNQMIPFMRAGYIIWYASIQYYNDSLKDIRQRLAYRSNHICRIQKHMYILKTPTIEFCGINRNPDNFHRWIS